MKFLDWLKKNLVNIVAMIIAMVGGADVVAGMNAGKSLTNVAVIPSLVGSVGAIGTLLFRWINKRTVTTRLAPAGLDPETMRFLESLYDVAGHVDVTPEMVTDLSNMAAATLIGHANRVKAERLKSAVTVIPATQRIGVSAMREALGQFLTDAQVVK